MKRTSSIFALFVTLAFALPLAAQDAKPPEMSPEQKAMMEAWEKAGTPGEQHKRLEESFAGNWTTAVTMWMDPKAPPETSTGKATYAMAMGGRYLREDYTGDYHGQPFTGLAYMGYNNVTGKYWTTWMDSMATALFVATGDFDPKTNTYTLRGEMNDPMANGAAVPVRMVTRVADKDRHVFEWHETHDGKEAKTMEIVYTRVK